MTKIKSIYIKLHNQYECIKRRKKLRHTDFSIISNNCWGGFVYQMFGLKYTSPTIGLFIMESDYVKFISDLRGYMNSELVFVRPEKTPFYQKLIEEGSAIDYPVARLKDIYIFFMHYTTESEAREKWNRRKNRINYKRLLVKMSERQDSNNGEVEKFCLMPYNNKICFTEKKYDNPCCVQVEGLKQLNVHGGDETPMTLEVVNIYDVLNNLK